MCKIADMMPIPNSEAVPLVALPRLPGASATEAPGRSTERGGVKREGAVRDADLGIDSRLQWKREWSSTVQEAADLEGLSGKAGTSKSVISQAGISQAAESLPAEAEKSPAGTWGAKVRREIRSSPTPERIAPGGKAGRAILADPSPRKRSAVGGVRAEERARSGREAIPERAEFAPRVATKLAESVSSMPLVALQAPQEGNEGAVRTTRPAVDLLTEMPGSVPVVLPDDLRPDLVATGAGPSATGRSAADNVPGPGPRISLPEAVRAIGQAGAPMPGLTAGVVEEADWRGIVSAAASRVQPLAAPLLPAGVLERSIPQPKRTGEESAPGAVGGVVGAFASARAGLPGGAGANASASFVPASFPPASFPAAADPRGPVAPLEVHPRSAFPKDQFPAEASSRILRVGSGNGVDSPATRVGEIGIGEIGVGEAGGGKAGAFREFAEPTVPRPGGRIADGMAAVSQAGRAVDGGNRPEWVGMRIPATKSLPGEFFEVEAGWSHPNQQPLRAEDKPERLTVEGATGKAAVVSVLSVPALPVPALPVPVLPFPAPSVPGQQLPSLSLTGVMSRDPTQTMAVVRSVWGFEEAPGPSQEANAAPDMPSRADSRAAWLGLAEPGSPVSSVGSVVDLPASHARKAQVEGDQIVSPKAGKPRVLDAFGLGIRTSAPRVPGEASLQLAEEALFGPGEVVAGEGKAGDLLVPASRTGQLPIAGGGAGSRREPVEAFRPVLESSGKAAFQGQTKGEPMEHRARASNSEGGSPVSGSRPDLDGSASGKTPRRMDRETEDRSPIPGKLFDGELRGGMSADSKAAAASTLKLGSGQVSGQVSGEVSVKRIDRAPGQVPDPGTASQDSMEIRAWGELSSVRAGELPAVSFHGSGNADWIEPALAGSGTLQPKQFDSGIRNRPSGPSESGGGGSPNGVGREIAGHGPFIQGPANQGPASQGPASQGPASQVQASHLPASQVLASKVLASKDLASKDPASKDPDTAHSVRAVVGAVAGFGGISGLVAIRGEAEHASRSESLNGSKAADGNQSSTQSPAGIFDALDGPYLPGGRTLSVGGFLEGDSAGTGLGWHGTDFRGVGFHAPVGGERGHVDLRASGLAVGYSDPILGYVELHATGNAAGVQASLVAHSPQVGSALESSLGELQTWMQQRHTPVERLTVEVAAGSVDGNRESGLSRHWSGEGAGGGLSHSGGEAHPGGESGDGKGRSMALSDPLETRKPGIPKTEESLPGRLVPGRLSLFA